MDDEKLNDLASVLLHAMNDSKVRDTSGDTVTSREGNELRDLRKGISLRESKIGELEQKMKVLKVESIKLYLSTSCSSVQTGSIQNKETKGEVLRCLGAGHCGIREPRLLKNIKFKPCLKSEKEEGMPAIHYVAEC